MKERETPLRQVMGARKRHPRGNGDEAWAGGDTARGIYCATACVMGSRCTCVRTLSAR